MSVALLRLSSCVGPVVAALLASLAATQTGTDVVRPRPSIAFACRKDPDNRDSDADPGLATTAETLGTLLNTHTGEAAALSSDEPSAERFASLLEDRITGSRVVMDARLLALLRELAVGRAPARVEIVSGYRSWKLNELLRKKGRRVASHSQHSRGQAMDFRIIGLSPSELHDRIEQTGWKGGIGTYPSVTDRFVHADTGPDRRWVGH